MTQSQIAVQNASATVTAAEYDPTAANMSIGSMGMRRSKRKGRNPSVGARGSRRYGLTMVFETGIPALYNSSSEPIY